MSRPNDYKYAPSHEWVKVDGANAVIGITDFAVQSLRDLVYIDLPAKGHKVQAGKRFGEIESVKAVSDLYSPVDGDIIDVNTALSDSIDTLAGQPFDGGWIIKVKMSNPSQVGTLMSAADYEKHVQSQQH